MSSGRAAGSLVGRESPRELFAELVLGAARETRPPPTDAAVAYLIELLEGRVRARPTPKRTDGGEPTLAEQLLEARLASGELRLRSLHAIGDRALFVSGFFGDSLRRSLVDLGYYRDVGRAAYADVAAGLKGGEGARAWTQLFQELADRFIDFVDVLAEVGDRSRRHSADLLRLYERYLETGSERDRRRLVRIGQLPPDRRRHRSWQ